MAKGIKTTTNLLREIDDLREALKASTDLMNDSLLFIPSRSYLASQTSKQIGINRYFLDNLKDHTVQHD